MDFPNLGNLELALQIGTHDPEVNSLWLPGQLQLQDYMGFFEVQSEVFEEVKIELLDILGDSFPEPKKRTIEMVHRTDRFERLADQTLEVKLDNPNETQNSTPQIVTVKHSRTYNKNCSLDEQLLAKGNSDISKNDKGEFKLTNIELDNPRVRSTFSDFKFTYEMPENWNENLAKYNEFVKTTFKDYLVKRNDKILELTKKGINPKKSIGKDDNKFYLENQKLIDTVDGTVNGIRKSMSQTIQLIQEKYSMKIGSHIIPFNYEEKMTFGLDDQNNILTLNNVAQKTNISRADLKNSRLERLEFNEKFQEEIKADLKKGPDKDYIRHARAIISEAFAISQKGFYEASIQRANSALEYILKSFVIESGLETSMNDLEDKTEYNLNALMTSKFNTAVKLLDPSAKKENGNFFNKEIKNKILYDNEKKNKATQTKEQLEEPRERNPIKKIRNNITHNTSDSMPTGEYRAMIILDNIAEAIEFVATEGWKKPYERPILSSDILTYAIPSLQDSVPETDGPSTIKMIKSNINQVLGYLQPAEVNLLKKIVQPNHLGYHDITKFEIKK